MSSVSEQLEACLAPYLGPNTARNAVRVFARRALRKSPEEVTPEEAALLVEAFRPMLRTLVGERRGEQLLLELRDQLHP
ncbi:hypothetical protein [Anaeromyxobacter paludicola]|uniref:Uncharacterized protein n=1 Tax=Anaeromyxobacter paludicola TaxID=2918171 RepID=A0ABN6NAZ7_9BACT|nr:hypothetical protein [Anaeromyxobacter paludicola]BDG09103.1 hypothetical protein AMPC_22160 [Anaeromyxobacter paludicola]